MDEVRSPILIVDDDADIRAALQHVLESAGYPTIQAPDGHWIGELEADRARPSPQQGASRRASCSST